MMLKAHQEFKSAEQLVESSKKNIQTQSLFLRSPGQEAQELHANLICILISGTNQNLKEKKKNASRRPTVSVTETRILKITTPTSK